MNKSFYLKAFLLFALLQSVLLYPQEDRSSNIPYFEQAAKEFGVPSSVLKSLAYSETRWKHLTWEKEDTASACNKLPRVYGIMGLWNNSYFGYALAEAAKLINMDPDSLMSSPLQNIRGAAALLSKYQKEIEKTEIFPENKIENWFSAIAKFSGYPQEDIAAQRAYDVMEVISDGFNDYGITIPKESINLIMLKDKLEKIKNKNSIKGTPDYPGAVWNPASTSNFSTSSNYQDFIVIHDIEGSYLSCISWFKNPAAQVSAHYVINGKKDATSDSVAGQVTQMVEERYKAWHVGCWNSYMIGIEHEGYASDPAWYTPQLYNASGNLIKYFCEKYSVLKDRNRIIAHSEWQNTNWKNWMATNYPGLDATCNTHTDPGKYWKWDSLFTIITQTNKEIRHGYEFVTSPWWDPNTSGSTYGISQLSTFSQSPDAKMSGTYSGKVVLIDSSQTSGWFARVVYSTATSSNDTIKFSNTGFIRIGLKCNSIPNGLKVRIAVNDNSSSSLEASTYQNIIADGTWKYYEWKLNDPNQWDNFSGGNGQIDGPLVYINSIHFSCSDPNSSPTQYPIYLDNLEHGDQQVNYLSLNLTARFQGLYDSVSGLSSPDTVTVKLRSVDSPFNIIDSARGILNSSGMGTFNFYKAPIASYYIVLNHRNHLETWSKSGGLSMSFGLSASYDFSDQLSKAFGNNLIIKGTKYCIYGGDINGDGFIDLADLRSAISAQIIYKTGYQKADINNDNTIDIKDLVLIDKNCQNNVSTKKP